MNDSLTIKDLARRGLECEHAIDQLLSDIWRDFETIEPVLAKKLAESFGSTEFAALMIIGRFKGQPSMLEELSAKPLTEEDIKNFIEPPPTFVVQPKEGAAESACGEMTDDELDDQPSLFNQAEQARKQYEQALLGIFRKMKEDDSEVANAVLELYEDENNAAIFLASPVHVLAGKSALEVIKDGGRKEVLELISRLEYGVHS